MTEPIAASCLQRIKAWWRARRRHSAARPRTRLRGFEPLEDRCAPAADLVTVDEGSQAVNAGAFADFALAADIAGITSSVDSVSVDQEADTWSWSFNTTDGPEESQIVTLTATDANGAQSVAQFELVVNNLAPTVEVNELAGPAGTLDLSFGGGDGIASMPTSDSSQINALELLPGGKILGGGFVGSDFALFVFNADGSLDTTFNSGGTAIADLGGYDAIQGLALASGGHIVAAGRITANPWSPWPHSLDGATAALARFRSDGSPDPTFDGDGQLAADLGPGDEAFFDVVVQPDGKIIAAGMMAIPGSATGRDFVVARFEEDGRLDTTFGGGDGMATADFGLTDNVARTVLLQADGRIIALGYASLSFDNSGFAVARFTADGVLDADFGSAGKFLLDLGADFAYEDIRGAAIQLDNKIVAAGQAWHHSAGPENYIVLFRMLPNGNLDSSFGTNGVVVSVFERDWNEGNAMALTADGDIVVGGDAPDLMNPHVLRYTENGSLDPGFGATGPGRTLVETPTGDNIYAVAVEPQGDVLLGGESGGSAVIFRFHGERQPARVTVNEGSQATNGGAFAELGNDVVTVTASIGTVTQTDARNGSWSWSFDTSDGPEQSQAVTITATDSDGAESAITFDLVVGNVAPSVALSGAGEINKLMDYTLHVGAITDPGADTIVSARVLWGDGFDTLLPNNGNVALTHRYGTPGQYTIRVDLLDEDGNPHRDAGMLQLLVRDQAANLRVTQKRKPAVAKRGAIITFRINVINLGNLPAYNSFLSYELPRGLIRVKLGSTRGWFVVGVRGFRFNLGNLAPGQSRTLVFKVRVGAGVRRGATLTTTALVLHALHVSGTQFDGDYSDNVNESRIRVV